MEEPLSHAGLGVAICSRKQGVNTATKPALSLVVGRDEYLEFLFVAAPLSAGLRYYGRELLPQFSVAAVISVGAQATHHQQTFGHPANLWLLVLFAVLAIFMGSAAYWMDKRFKITHWEKDS